jgi:hypothetical protein
MVDQNESMSALSTLKATLPIDPRSTAVREPVTEDSGVLFHASMDVYDGVVRWSLPAGHVSSFDIEFITSVIGDRLADQTHTPEVDDRAAVKPPIARIISRDVGTPDPMTLVGRELTSY